MKNLAQILNGYNLSRLADVVIDSRKSLSEHHSLYSGQIIFCKTDFLPTLFKVLHDSDGRYTLISHCSDYPITEKLYKMAPSCIRKSKWYAQNADFQAENLIPVPIGIENHDGPSKGKNTDFAALLEALNNFPAEVYDKVYCNFRPTNPSRAEILTTLRDAGRAEIVAPKPFASYLSDLKKHQFIASPRGNGIDCHRTWEAVLIGRTPIVERHFMFDGIAGIIQTDDWKDFSLETSPQTVNKEIMNMNYWSDRIRSER